ncbi:MAG: hypothetical protein FJ095_15320, partial [Deltaproteobacteria bacterium]|nr:hypothetical protein [Deltaproteobacteria bacterium]
MSRSRTHILTLLSSAAAFGVALASVSSGCATSGGDTDVVAATATASTATGSGGAGGTGEGGSGGSIGPAGSGGSDGDASSSSSSSSSSSASSSGSGGNNLCGNGMLDKGEACDGQDFGSKTCADYGLAGGQLQCNKFCTVVVSGCTPPENCSNGDDDDKDGAVDCSDTDCKMAPTCTDSCAAPVTLTDGDFD